MNFSAVDIPIQLPNPFGEIVEQIRKIEPNQNVLSSGVIADLASKIDDSVARSHAAVNLVIQYDLNWRAAVFQGDTEYDEAIEKRIEFGLSFLTDSMERPLISDLDNLRPYGVYSESVESLRTRVAEIRSMLTPDDEFFEGEELDELAAQAIAADESGQTVEFRVMGE